MGSWIVVCVGFAAESAYMFYADRRVDEVAGRVQSDLLPAVHHLTAIRRAMVDLAACTPAPAKSLSAIFDCAQSARDRMTVELDRFDALSDFPEKRARSAKVRQIVGTLDAQLGDVRAAVGSPARFEVAMASLVATLPSLGDALDGLAQANVRNKLQISSRITALLHRSELTESVLSLTALVVAAVAIVFGVRANRRYQRHLERRANELENFAGTVAHDLLTPLASLGIVLPVIQHRHPNDQETNRLTARSLSSIKRVRTLVDGLLEFSRAGGVPSGMRTDVAGVARDVVAELSEQAIAANLELVVEQVDGVVACSTAVLYSILSNLVANAIKYADDAADRRVRLRAATRNQRVVIEVEDGGPGVPPFIADAIFEPYIRVRGSSKPGLGLGLATVKRLVLAHGGAVGVRAADERGAIFWLSLPSVSAVTANPAARA